MIAMRSYLLTGWIINVSLKLAVRAPPVVSFSLVSEPSSVKNQTTGLSIVELQFSRSSPSAYRVAFSGVRSNAPQHPVWHETFFSISDQHIMRNKHDIRVLRVLIKYICICKMQRWRPLYTHLLTINQNRNAHRVWNWRCIYNVNVYRATCTMHTLHD